MKPVEASSVPAAFPSVNTAITSAQRKNSGRNLRSGTALVVGVGVALSLVGAAAAAWAIWGDQSTFRHRSIEPLGYYVSEELQGGLGTTGGVIRPTQKEDQFLVVVVRVTGSQLALSKAEYASYIQHERDTLSSGETRRLEARENVRRFNPDHFTLILADGRGIPAQLIGNWKLMSSLGGFSPGTVTHSQSGKPAEFEEIAIACVVEPSETAPPFKVQYLKDPVATVPNRKLTPPK